MHVQLRSYALCAVCKGLDRPESAAQEVSPCEVWMWDSVMTPTPPFATPAVQNPGLVSSGGLNFPTRWHPGTTSTGDPLMGSYQMGDTCFCKKLPGDAPGSSRQLIPHWGTSYELAGIKWNYIPGTISQGYSSQNYIPGI